MKPAMTTYACLSAQAALQADIKAPAIELGYDPAKVEPIYDGVVDAEAYLASNPRIMWILTSMPTGCPLAAAGRCSRISALVTRSQMP